MPILPDDFDSSPSQRTVRIDKFAKRRSVLDRQRGAAEEPHTSSLAAEIKKFSLAWRAPLTLSLLAIVLLTAAQKPLARLLGRLQHKPAPATLVLPPAHAHASLGHTIQQPPNESSQQQASRQQPGPEPPATLPVHAHPIPISDSKAFAFERSMQRQKADLELESKRLADAQAALENQRRQDAQIAANAAEQTRQEEALRARRLQEQEALFASERAKEKSLPAPLPTPAYKGPSSGTLVWQGNVEGADLIDIQNGAASLGDLSGQLPGVPVMVQASPADQVTIAIAPGPSNEWKRIVLRVRSKGFKKVTVRWVIP